MNDSKGILGIHAEKPILESNIIGDDIVYPIMSNNEVHRKTRDIIKKMCKVSKVYFTESQRSSLRDFCKTIEMQLDDVRFTMKCYEVYHKGRKYFGFSYTLVDKKNELNYIHKGISHILFYDSTTTALQWAMFSISNLYGHIIDNRKSFDIRIK